MHVFSDQIGGGQQREDRANPFCRGANLGNDWCAMWMNSLFKLKINHIYTLFILKSEISLNLSNMICGIMEKRLKSESCCLIDHLKKSIRQSLDENITTNTRNTYCKIKFDYHRNESRKTRIYLSNRYMRARAWDTRSPRIVLVAMPIHTPNVAQSKIATKHVVCVCTCY